MQGLSLRYTGSLRSINWRDILDMELPLTNSHKKNIILHLSGQYAIHPVLLLSKVSVDENNMMEYAMKTEDEFRISLRSFANDLSRHDQDFDSESITTIPSSLEYSLFKVFNQNDKLINEFLGICHSIMKRHDISSKTTFQMKQQPTLKRDNERQERQEEIGLELPYGKEECWQLSATHNGAVQAADSSRYVMSAIDMSPSLYHNWLVPFDYLFSDGDIYAAHSGFVKKHSECALEVFDNATEYSTYYSHLNLSGIDDNVWVDQGENIGRISLDPVESNCKCDWPVSSFLCATGPHVHFELRYNGTPSTLNAKIISNIRIKTGTYAHDHSNTGQYCSDPDHCESATINGELCATTFTHVDTGEVFCPVTKGNFGMLKYLITSIYMNQYWFT